MLIDSNVLIHSVDTSSEWHRSCRDLVERAMARVVEAVLVPQVLTEFLGIVTSRRVRSPLPAAAAVDQVADWRAAIPMRLPNPRCLDEFEALLPRTSRSGQRIYDVFLAAQMRAHGVTEVCTLNVRDFTGIPGITVLSPAAV